MSDNDDIPPPPIDDLNPTSPVQPSDGDPANRTYFGSSADSVPPPPSDGPTPLVPARAADDHTATRPGGNDYLTRSHDYTGPDQRPPELPGFCDLDKVGSGGMGIVYKARQLALSRVVALKMLRQDVPREPDGSISPRWRERFEEEAKSLARLQHPNIVQIHDAGEAAGSPYLVMEFVAGGTLDARLAGTSLPTPLAAADMVRTLARAVQAAHDLHVVHRDLKPANVLVTPEGVLKIADFGLAKLLDEASDGLVRESMAGTPGYMAPEQVRGEPVTPRVDVYALGAILYKMLVNRPPFSSDSKSNVMRMVCELTPAPPRSLQPGIPADLEAICLKCLEKDAPARYQSAAALADDLDRFLKGEPTIARPVRWGKRQWMWAKRRPAVAGLWAAAILLVATSIGLAALAAQNTIQRLRGERDQATLFDAGVVAAEQRSTPSLVVIEPGWKRQAAIDLRRVAGAPLAGQHTERLRNLYAAIESRIDLEEVGVVAAESHLSCLVASPDGTKVAAGDAHDADSVEPVMIRLYTRGQLFKHPVTDGMSAIAFSADSRWLAIGSRGGKVLVWDTNTPDARLHELTPAHGNQVNGVAFSPDGSRLLSVSKDKTVAVWDPASWMRIATVVIPRDGEPRPPELPRDREPLGVSFYSGNRRSITGGRLGITEDLFIIGTDGGGNSSGGASYRIEELKPVAEKLKGNEFDSHQEFRHICYANAGDVVALGSERHIVLHGVYQAREIQSLVDPVAGGAAHKGVLTGISIDPTGTILASGGDDNYLKLWDITTGRLLLRTFFPGDDGVLPAFNPATGELHVAANNKLVRYRIVHPASVRLMGPQLAPVDAVAFLGDGAAIASATWHSVGNYAVWKAEDGSLLMRHPYLWNPNPGNWPSLSLTATPDGNTLVSGGVAGRDFLKWDWTTKKESDAPESLPKPQLGMTSFLRFAPDGKTLWGVYPLQKGGMVRSISWPEKKDIFAKSDQFGAAIAKRASITCLDVGRTWAAVGSADCSVKLIRTADPNAPWQTLPTGHENPVHCVALSPDESLVLAGTRSGQVLAFRLPGGEPIDTPIRHRDTAEAIAFSPDGRLLATAGRDHTIHLWQRDGTTFRSLVTYPTHGPVNQLTFSRDGTRLAFIVEGQRAFNVWNVARFREQLKSMGLDW